MSKWYKQSGNQADTVISSRVRLARNLKDYPFPCKLNNEGLQKICKLVWDAIVNSDFKNEENLSYIDINKISQEEKVSLVERHIISPEFATKKTPGGLILSEDESISIMINEEDHIRIQVMKQGLDLENAFDIADKIDTILDKQLSVAFDDKLGYLTQCPTNLGTGMRASLMLHLKALEENGAMDRIASNLSKLGLTLRGTYGEGSKAKGSIYQLSNQVTLGISEKEAIENLKIIAKQLIDQEKAAREKMAQNIDVIDTISRSMGILLNAKLLDHNEFMRLISNVRFGVSINAIKNVTYDVINELIIELQPATLMKNEGKKLTALERDKKRAELVQEKLSKYK